MKLISCENCGVVIDQDRYNFDEFEFYDEEGQMKNNVGIWMGDYYVALIECPVCKHAIETDYKI